MAFELQPGRGPKVEIGIPPVLGKTPEAALTYIIHSAHALDKLNDHKAFIAVEVGRQLKMIQEQNWHERYERRDYTNLEHPEGIPLWGEDEEKRYCLSFHDFLGHVVAPLFHIDKRQAWNLLLVGKSTVLTQIDEHELRSMRSQANAITIAKIEKQSGPEAVTKEMIQDAKVLTRNEFQDKYHEAVPRQVVGKTITATHDKAWIIEQFLDGLTANPLNQLKEMLEDGLVRCGDNPNELAEVLVALATVHFSEDDERLRQEQNPVQTEAEYAETCATVAQEREGEW